MRKHHFLFLLFAFLFLSGQALAQTGPPIFVSTFSGRQILRIDGTTVTVIHTGVGSGILRPEDIVVGPDGKIYICDTSTDQIWRMNQDGSEFEIIYDRTAAMILVPPPGPEGPSFLNDDLYFNTRGPSHTGVWKIPGVATIPFGALGVLNPAVPDPVNLIDAGGTGSAFGEGTAFDRLGNLLIVDRSNNKVLRSTPPFGPGTTSSLITANLDTPFGIAVNSTGDIFVASGGTQTNINRFDSSGSFVATFVSFASPDSPFFLEFDASDNLYVVTANTSGADGKVWKVDTGGVKTLLVDLSVAFPTPPDLASTGAVGLAVPATEVSKTAEFSDDQKTNTYDFGSHKFILSLDVNVGREFFVKITAKDVRPKDLKSRLDPNVFPPGSDCVRFPGKGGKCVVYRAEGNPSMLPIPGTDFTGLIEILIKYFDDPVSPTVDPRMAHAIGEEAGITLFDEDMTFEFFPNMDPDDPDPALSGRTTRWSEFVVVNVDQVFLQIEIDIKPGSFPNSIKLSGTGAVPVAILSTNTFDATTVDPSTVELNSASVRFRGKGLQAHFEDVNVDGLLDLVVQIDRGGFEKLGDGIGLLTGRTFSGDPVFGTDSVRIVE